MFITFSISGQYFENPEKKTSFADKLYFGGGLGLQFGTVTQIEVAPLVGYKLTKRFHPGISATYSYYNDKRYSVPFEYSTYGGSVFFRFFLFEGLFAHAEAEFLNVKVYTFTTINNYTTQRQWIENYLVGGGYYQKLGQRSGMYFLILWNLNETDLTPYSNPVMRIGFNF
jgi:hypothetical protein